MLARLVEGSPEVRFPRFLRVALSCLWVLGEAPCDVCACLCPPAAHWPLASMSLSFARCPLPCPPQPCCHFECFELFLPHSPSVAPTLAVLCWHDLVWIVAAPSVAECLQGLKAAYARPGAGAIVSVDVLAVVFQEVATPGEDACWKLPAAKCVPLPASALLCGAGVCACCGS